MDVPHLAWPFRFLSGGRRLATVEQDGIEDVQQNVRAYLHTTRGERSLSPDFGLEDPTFGPGVDPTVVAAEIEEADDFRSVVTIVAAPPDGTGRQVVEVSVELAE